DVLISPFLHDDVVDVYVVSDKLEPFSGTIHTWLLDFSGNILLDQTKVVQIPAQSSAVYLNFNTAQLLGKADPHGSFLVLDLEVGGKRISRNLQFFDVTHNLELPVAPNIEATLSKAGEGYAVTLKSSKLARSIYVSFGDLDVHTADNYFDLIPGESVTVALKSAASLDQLK